MKTIDLIRWALRTTDEGIAALVEGMRDAPLTFSTPGAEGGDGNHPLWTLGHLCVVEGIVIELVTGEKNPVEHWKSMFGTGTRPTAEASAYPSFDEVLRTHRAIRARTLSLLEDIGDAGLNRAPKLPIPPGFEDAMQTAGRALLLIALHQMVHYGEIADARRVAGLKPLM